MEKNVSLDIAWVRFWGMPICHYNKSTLLQASASTMDKFMKIDYNTKKVQHGN